MFGCRLPRRSAAGYAATPWLYLLRATHYKIMYSSKLVISGSDAEVYLYSNNILPKKERSASSYLSKSRPLSAVVSDVDYREKSQRRAKRDLRRLVACNAGRHFKNGHRPFMPMFLTLTFKENVSDLSFANAAFMRFIQRLNYAVFRPRGMKMCYLAVSEFQRRGAVHYHLIVFNLPYIKKGVYRRLREIWRKNNSDGAVFLEPVKRLDGLARYLTKYLVKNFADERFVSRKRFFGSRNLLRPIIMSGDDLVVGLFLDMVREHQVFVCFLGTFEYVGSVIYRRYKIPDFVSV